MQECKTSLVFNLAGITLSISYSAHTAVNSRKAKTELVLHVFLGRVNRCAIKWCLRVWYSTFLGWASLGNTTKTD